MPSTFFGLSIGASALQAAQIGENVVGNNIANANTPGYSEETLNLTENPPYSPADGSTILQPGMVGTGVNATSITRATDDFATGQLRDALSEQSFNTTQQSALQQVQTAFGEPSTTGLDSALSSFYQSFNNVQSNPEDNGVRAATIQDGVAVTSSMHTISQQLGDVSTALTQQSTANMTTLNNDGAQIATLNIQISQSRAQGQQPNELMDQRDLLIGAVAGLANVSVVNQPNGMVNVAIGSSDLVVGNSAYTLTMGGLQARGDLQSGTLAGIATSQTAVQGAQTMLDTVASTVASTANAVQASGADAYGDTGATSTPFFTGTTAATLSVSPALINDPGLLAAAAAPAGGGAPPAGDGSNAANFAAIASQAIATAPFSGQTLQQYYASGIAGIGAQAASVTSAATSANVNVQKLQQQADSVTGVSTDAEMVNMLKYQQAYSAAAEYIQTSNAMIGTLITDLHS
jgi:flagellar hook-associated protein 1 FlgK